MSAAPNPTKLILLGAIGIGVYFFMSRRAQAAPVAVSPTSPQAGATYARNDAAMWATIWNQIGRPTLNDIAARTAAAARASGAADTTNPGNYIGDEAVYLSSSAVDGMPINPVTSSVFDFSTDLARIGGLDGM